MLLIQSVVFVVLAAFTYQGTIALYIVLSMPLVLKYADSLKKYLTNIFYLIIPYIVSGISVMLLFFRTESDRSSSNEGVFSNIKHAVSAVCHFFYDTFDLMPKLGMGIIFLVVILSAIYGICHQNKKHRVIHIFIMLFISVLFSTATIIQGAGWNAMRVVYPLASIIGMLAFDMRINQSNTAKQKINVNVIVTTTLIILMFFQYISFNKLFIDKNKNDIADRVRVQFIGNQIEKYEADTGNKIEKIAFYYDSEPSYPSYPGLYFNRDLIVSLFYTYWSDVKGINYYLQSDYKRTDAEEKYRKYFSEYNWDGISSEQLVFDEDTLHICNY